MAFSVKGEKKSKHTTHAHEKQEPSIFQQYTQSTTNTNAELFYSASLRQKMPILGVCVCVSWVYVCVCVYIYTYIYMYFSGLLLTYF